MKILKLSGTIVLKTGLHIGGGDDAMKIGGIDSQVIKDANTNKPYIPGSSLKGKMRSLLEWHLGLAGLNGGKPFAIDKIAPSVSKEDALNLVKLFGNANTNSSQIEPAITRISVSDCALSEGQEEMVLSEAKYENIINRIKGTAEHPRQIERVPAGVKFDYEIRLKIFDGDDETALKSMVETALNLVENDYLGGSGSRGYGRVAFSNKSGWSE